MAETIRSFDAPIPGMSLTAELGARPWQSEPQYPTVEEAIQYYMDNMTTESFMDQLIDVIEMGVPNANIVNVMQLRSVTEGIHTVDVGVIVSPLLVEMIMFLAESAGVEYETGLENPEKGELTGAKKAKVLNKLRREIEEKENEEPVKEEEVKEEIKVKEETLIPKGLMARRQ